MPGPEETTASYTAYLEEDEEGNLILPIPDELMEVLSWGEGDVLEIYTVHKQIVFRKVKDGTGTASEVQISD